MSIYKVETGAFGAQYASATGGGQGKEGRESGWNNYYLTSESGKGHMFEIIVDGLHYCNMNTKEEALAMCEVIFRSHSGRVEIINHGI